MFFDLNLLSPKSEFSYAWIASTRGIKFVSRHNILEFNICRTCTKLYELVCRESGTRRGLSLRLAALLINGVLLIFLEKIRLLLEEAIKLDINLTQPLRLDLSPKTPEFLAPTVRPLRKVKKPKADVVESPDFVIQPQEESVQARVEDITLREVEVTRPPLRDELEPLETFKSFQEVLGFFDEVIPFFSTRLGLSPERIRFPEQPLEQDIEPPQIQELEATVQPEKTIHQTRESIAIAAHEAPPATPPHVRDISIEPTPIAALPVEQPKRPKPRKRPVITKQRDLPKELRVQIIRRSQKISIISKDGISIENITDKIHVKDLNLENLELELFKDEDLEQIERARLHASSNLQMSAILRDEISVRTPIPGDITEQPILTSTPVRPTVPMEVQQSLSPERISMPQTEQPVIEVFAEPSPESICRDMKKIAQEIIDEIRVSETSVTLEDLAPKPLRKAGIAATFRALLDLHTFGYVKLQRDSTNLQITGILKGTKMSN